MELLKIVTYFLPSRFEVGTDCEEMSELCYAATRLLSLLYDWSTKGPLRDRISSRSVNTKIVDAASVLLAVIGNVQVLLEMFTLRKEGERARRKLIVHVEATKLALRLIVIGHRRSLLSFGGSFVPQLAVARNNRRQAQQDGSGGGSVTRSAIENGNRVGPGGANWCPALQTLEPRVTAAEGWTPHRRTSACGQGTRPTAVLSTSSATPLKYVGHRTHRKMKVFSSEVVGSRAPVAADDSSSCALLPKPPNHPSSTSAYAATVPDASCDYYLSSALRQSKSSDALPGSVATSQEAAIPAWFDTEQDPRHRGTDNINDTCNSACSRLPLSATPVFLSMEDTQMNESGIHAVVERSDCSHASTSIIPTSTSPASVLSPYLANVSTNQRDLALEIQRERWIMASETLFFSRPLLQALLNCWFSVLSSPTAKPSSDGPDEKVAEVAISLTSRRLRALAFAVAVDLFALWCWFKAEKLRLRQSFVRPLSDEEKEERQRRKMTYILYLLRAPLWDSATRPVVDIVERGAIVLLPPHTSNRCLTRAILPVHHQCSLLCP
jgi:hypothetical protein